jgi:hypothetical protein
MLLLHAAAAAAGNLYGLQEGFHMLQQLLPAASMLQGASRLPDPPLLLVVYGCFLPSSIRNCCEV